MTDRSPRVASRRAVEAALERLRADHGDFPVFERRERLDRAAYDRHVERVEAGTLGGAGTWCRNGAGEVLLVREEPGGPWSEPAGKHEPGETLAGTARRETREETGVDCELEGVLAVQRVTYAGPGRGTDAGPLHRVIVTFEARYAGGEARPRDDEIAAVRWFDEHPDRLRYPLLREFPI